MVVESYAQLAAEGYLVIRPRSSTRVTERPVPTAARGTVRATLPARYDFHAGRPDLGEFPRSIWLRSVRRAMNLAPSARLDYDDPAGIPELREALAGYLNRVRGAATDPGLVIVCNGFSQGLGLLGQVLSKMGSRRLAVEDPSHPGSRQIVEAAGLEIVAVAVDEEGIRVDVLSRTAADAVLVTPAHQYPTGVVLAPEPRTALIDWAIASNTLIIEDDYDAEYRFDRQPIGALHGLAPDRVVYGGSASKTLAPGLRLGWLVVPPWLVEQVAAAKAQADRGSSALEQLALADFLAAGELDRHLRRMRPIYQRRRDALLDALGWWLPGLMPMGTAAGLHLVARLPPELDEGTIVTRAAAASIAVYGMASCTVASTSGPGALVLGYGGMSESAIRAGIQALARAIV